MMIGDTSVSLSATNDYELCDPVMEVVTFRGIVKRRRGMKLK